MSKEDDDEGGMSYNDFDSHSDRTIGEQRMRSRVSGSSNTSSASQGGSGKSFGQRFMRGSSKLLGGMGSAAVGSVSAVAEGVSSVASKVGGAGASNEPAPSQASSGGGGYPQGGGQPVAPRGSDASESRVATLEAQKKDAIAREDFVMAQAIKAQIEALQGAGQRPPQDSRGQRNPPQAQSSSSAAPPPPPPSQPQSGSSSQPENGSSSSGSRFSVGSAMMSGAKGVFSVGSGAVGLVSSGVGAVGSLVSNGPGTEAGSMSADVALGLVSACFELIAASVPACGADNAMMELASHIDAVVAARNLNDLGARLLDFWYVLRPDALSPWGLVYQQTWVWTMYGIKYGEIKAAPRPMARTLCGLLLELGLGCKASMLTWQSEQADAWASQLRNLAQMVDETPPPAGWGFPAFVIARNGAGTGELEFGQTGYSVARSDQKGVSRSHGQEVLMALKSAGVIRVVRQTRIICVDGETATPKDLIGDPKATVSSAGGPKLAEKCDEKCSRLFTQKTKPIHLHNQGSTPLKACLYSDTDRLCAVPVGGLGGPCVTTLDPNCRAQMRPPGKSIRYQLKVMAPGIIETNLYFANVFRGQHVQLRSRDCTVEDK